MYHEVRNTHINIGTGIDISKPDGTMQKLTNVSKLHALGWKHTVSLNKGVEKMYAWYLS